MKDKELDERIADAIMERPTVFEVDGEAYYVYPMTLGKMLLLLRLMERMEINVSSLSGNVTLELMRVVEKSKDECCSLLAYMTARNDYYDVFDHLAYKRRVAAFSTLDDGDLVSLLTLILSGDRTEEFIKHLGIDKEQADMKKVMDVKKNDGSFTFGGVSMYGTLIDSVMERYGVTKRYVVWELDYTSMKILLADRVNTVYVSDDERKKIHIPKDRTRVNGDDREAVMRAIMSQDWE